MNKVEVFDPPMCCSTGVCGPSVDRALARFAASEVVKTALKQYGNECLPLILLNGAVIGKGCYPARDELARLTGVEPEQPGQAQTGPKLPVINTRCC
jgi:hypothetical protein